MDVHNASRIEELEKQKQGNVSRRDLQSSKLHIVVFYKQGKNVF